jgi:Ser/Thr protein kinase RdoA (MazF antagonist)
LPATGILPIVVDDTTLGEWCHQHLKDGLGSVLFRTGHLSEVVGVQLTSGRRVVIKVRPYEPRLTGCLAVQDHLARTGFPCPAPLTGLTRLGVLAVTAETAVPGGGHLATEAGAAPFATLLAHLIDSAPDPSRTPSLAPSPPWTAWDHSGALLWPDADDEGRDLNALPGPAWIDETARRVRDRLTVGRASVRIGHGDWESQNIVWVSGAPLAVHDWDSVIAQPEACIVGLAAAVWPATGAASVAQTEDFIASYQAAHARAWTQSEVQDAWAAGLWVRLFNARKDAAVGGGPRLDRLEDEVDERVARAALD